MQTTLIVHIGHRKTGTSSIQSALARGRIRLPGCHLFYPAAVNHNYLAHHVRTYRDSGTAPTGTADRPGLQMIGQRIRDAAPDHAILSGEEFEGMAPATLMGALDRFVLPHVQDHRILCYVRPHAQRILSSFAESVKIGRPLTSIAQFHANSRKAGRFIYAPRMAAWRDAVPGRFILRPFVRERLLRQSVVWDFLQAICGDRVDQAQIADGPARNESLCIEDLLLLRLVQDAVRHRGSKPLGIMLGWELARLIGTGLPRTRRTRPALHRALAEDIRHHYRGDARALDRDHVDQPVFMAELDRAVDEALPQAQSFDPAAYYSPDALDHIRVLARLIDTMLDNDRGDWVSFLRDSRYRAGQDQADGADSDAAGTDD